MPNSSTTLTILVENTARQTGILAEHGMSVWIEAQGKHVLFDTGQGMALPHNTQELGIDVANTDAIVLSHGHYDHVGGLDWALKQAPGATLFMHPDATQRKFSDSANGVKRVSLPFMEQSTFKTPGRKIVHTKSPMEIVPGVWTTGEVPRVTDFEDVGGPFFLDESLQTPDPLLDDQSLFIMGPDGMSVIFGCAHAGIVNTLMHIDAITGGEHPIRLLCGGLHLLAASSKRMHHTIEFLKQRPAKEMVFCHCTGNQAVRDLHLAFPETCTDGHAGMKLMI